MGLETMSTTTRDISIEVVALGNSLFFNAGCNEHCTSVFSLTLKKIWPRSILSFSRKTHTLIPKNGVVEG